MTSKAKLTDLDAFTLLFGSRKIENRCGLLLRSGARFVPGLPGNNSP